MTNKSEATLGYEGETWHNIVARQFSVRRLPLRISCAHSHLRTCSFRLFIQEKPGAVACSGRDFRRSSTNGSHVGPRGRFRNCAFRGRCDIHSAQRCSLLPLSLPIYALTSRSPPDGSSQIQLEPNGSDTTRVLMLETSPRQGNPGTHASNTWGALDNRSLCGSLAQYTTRHSRTSSVRQRHWVSSHDDGE